MRLSLSGQRERKKPWILFASAATPEWWGGRHRSACDAHEKRDVERWQEMAQEKLPARPTEK